MTLPEPPALRRRSIRLAGYNYAAGGAYFLTLCAHERRCVFGAIENGHFRPSPLGAIVADEWLRTAEIRREVELDAYVVMPNHFHAIVVLQAGEPHFPSAQDRGEFASMQRNSVASLVAGFKSAVTRRSRELGNAGRNQIWQRNYYEHIVRDERDLARIRDYVAANPARWAEDAYHPDHPPQP